MADAPNLRAYWAYREKERLVGVMPRDAVNFSSLRDDGVPVSFDISGTPIGDITRDSVVLDSYAWRIDETRVRVATFRDDPKDGAAERVNQNQFDIITDIEKHPRFTLMLAPASTCHNGNMRDFCADTLAFTRRCNGDGFTHRLPAVPSPEDLIRST